MHGDDPEDVPNLRWRPSARKHFLVPLMWLGTAILMTALLIGWEVLQRSSPVVLVLCIIGAIASLIGDVWLLFRRRRD